MASMRTHRAENSPVCMKAIHTVGLASESLNKGHYLKKEKNKKQKMGLMCINIPICIPLHSTKYQVDFDPQIRNKEFRLEMCSPWVLV